MTMTLNLTETADLLDGPWGAIRRRTRGLCLDPELRKIEGLPYGEHRERVLGQLHKLVELGLVQRAFPAALGGEDNHGGNIASFEELVVGDPSVQIKAGVQWGLFGSAILHLGTSEHHQAWLPGIMSLELPGVFAMTEIGHGSDVASLGTTATFDEKAQEFVLNTPTRSAWKDYLGNAAAHGQAAVVFAQLITKGVNHGVHAFFCPIRSRAGDGTTQLLEGISAEDDGLKGGLNGIDNGRLAFDQVRIPRTNLLNRYGDVASDGTYSSPIASPGRRFFTMLGTLVQGRVSLSGAAVVVSKMALATAIRYGNERRQFSSHEENTETVLMDYGRHQRRLLPLLARTYAAQFLHHELLDRFHEVFSGANDTDEDRQDLENLAAASKAATTWLCLEVLDETRQACGGAGYLAENKFVGWRQDMDVYATFEGDNNVLLQLVGKRLLNDLGKKMARMDVAGAVRYVAEQARDVARHRTPLRRAAQSIADFGSVARSAVEVREGSVQRELLEDRVETMIEEIGAALRRSKDGSPHEQFDVFNAHQNQLLDAARAHAHLLQWEAFTDVLDKVADAETRQILTWLRDLFGLTLIEENLDWYLLNGRLSAGRARTVTSYIDRLLARLRPHAGELVEAFGYSRELVGATIGTGAEAQRQEAARDYYRTQRARGLEPMLEKHLNPATT